ncbi:hypothetical protein HY604_05300 [Candidatus Peregrinibacteria bacterium]|nr:hypothetical protein [Candidatus Peregrinibacteria bacterium]
MKRIEKIIMSALALMNLIAQVYIYLLHADYLDTIGIEAVKELSVTPIVLGVLIMGAILFTYPFRRFFISFFSFSSLSLTLYIAATHSGDRSGVSLLDRPQYVVAILALAALISWVQFRRADN